MASLVNIKFVDESENFDFEKSGKQNSLTGPVITGSFEKRAPDPLTMGRAAMGTKLKIVARSLNRLKKIIMGHGDVFSHLIVSCFM